MRAVTICQGRSHSLAFVWLDLSSLHNSIQSSSCWQRLSGSRQRNTPPPPTHSLQLLWMEKCWKTAQDRQERKWSTNWKASDLMTVYSTRHTPHVQGWTCVTSIRKPDDENNKWCTFTLVDTLPYNISISKLHQWGFIAHWWFMSQMWLYNNMRHTLFLFILADGLL